MKFENGYYLYIEVKGIPDINASKTELLKNAYTDYFDKRASDLFSSKLVIAVLEVNTTNNSYPIHSYVYLTKWGWRKI